MPMKDSKLPDDWLAKTIAANPMRKLENGNYLSGPVRLAFVHLDKPVPKKNTDGTINTASPAVYQCNLLFPEGALQGIQTVLWPACYEVIRASFAANIGSDGQPFGLNSTFRDQREAQKYAGYTPGCMFTGLSSQFKPPVVDVHMNPIVDPARVYAGVWAIVAVNCYASGIGQPKKGPRFGLQSVMIIADDNRLDGGGSADPKADFAGVNIDANYDPTMQFGATPIAAAPGVFMPPAMAVSAPPALPGYAPPPPGVPVAPGIMSYAPAAPTSFDDLI